MPTAIPQLRLKATMAMAQLLKNHQQKNLHQPAIAARPNVLVVRPLQQIEKIFAEYRLACLFFMPTDSFLIFIPTVIR